MSCEEAAMWSAPLGVAVTHSPQRRFQVWMQPESRKEEREALCGNRVAPSTGQLGEPQSFPESVSRRMSQVCPRVSVTAFAGKSVAWERVYEDDVVVPVLPEAVSGNYPQPLVIKFTFGLWCPGPLV